MTVSIRCARIPAHGQAFIPVGARSDHIVVYYYYIVVVAMGGMFGINAIEHNDRIVTTARQLVIDR